MFLIDSILLLPLKPVLWFGKKLDEIVRKELSDEGRVKEQLMELQLRFELDEVSQEEYEKQEKELLDRLDGIMKTKEMEGWE